METKHSLIIEKIESVVSSSREIETELKKNGIEFDCTDICEIILSSNNLLKGIKRHERRIIRRQNKR